MGIVATVVVVVEVIQVGVGQLDLDLTKEEIISHSEQIPILISRVRYMRKLFLSMDRSSFRSNSQKPPQILLSLL